MKMNASYRPAWVEIDLSRLRQNFSLFLKDKPAALGFISVVKDQAYGHGMVQIAKVALEFGAKSLAVATVDAAIELRQSGISAPVLVFGERTTEELELCVAQNLTCFVNDMAQADNLKKLAVSVGQKMPVHVEVDSGLSRYGVRWTEALPVIEYVAGLEGLVLEGVMSHFAMSDELDKTFALEQLKRFNLVLAQMAERQVRVKCRHICNTGGYLDLPQAHLDFVRIGILPLGVYPSQVCRRIPGLEPVLSVKTRIVGIRELQVGDYVGYGMRYLATEPRRIAVLPIGYGDGYPRVRNQGEVLLAGKRAPIVGGNAMDAMMVDISNIPQAKVGDEVVLQGCQGDDEIDVHEIAGLKGSVSYDILTGWRSRLPRLYLNAENVRS